jgi:7,8-dihydropterin-6-yl-methyl-4-(beta-D-ribofuranosyl)aminobenzene 5'-phosphate synthase
MRWVKAMILFMMVSGAAMANEITIKIVYNNVPFNRDLETSWGMACVIEGLDKTILFDTGGDGRILLSNMKAMEIEPRKIDVVVLSHIHGDHTGGLESFLNVNSSVTVYVPSSFPGSLKKSIKETGSRLVEVSGPLEIYSHVYSTGELGTWIKEQALVLKTKKGLIVITGCAHPGVVEIARTALALYDGSIYLIAGGFHLGGTSGKEIDRIISELKGFGVQKVGPCHCTGDSAIHMFREAWGKNFVEAGCGAVIKIADE